MSDATRTTRSGRPELQLGRAIRLVWSSAPGWVSLNTALVVVQGVLPLANPYLMKRSIDAIGMNISAPRFRAVRRAVVAR